MKWNIIFIFTARVTKWTGCYGSQWFGTQEQKPWNKTREEDVISWCKHSTSIICVFIDGILWGLLVESEKRSGAVITELNTGLGVIHAPVEGWPSASHLISLHLWASLLLSATFLSDSLSFPFCLYRAWYGRTVSAEATKCVNDLIESTASSSDSEALVGVCLM